MVDSFVHKLLRTKCLLNPETAQTVTSCLWLLGEECTLVITFSLMVTANDCSKAGYEQLWPRVN